MKWTNFTLTKTWVTDRESFLHWYLQLVAFFVSSIIDHPPDFDLVGGYTSHVGAAVHVSIDRRETDIPHGAITVKCSHTSHVDLLLRGLIPRGLIPRLLIPRGLILCGSPNTYSCIIGAGHNEHIVWGKLNRVHGCTVTH